MKIKYRFVIDWNVAWVAELQQLGLSVSPSVRDPMNGGVAIVYVEEGHPSWAEASGLMRMWGATMTYTTEFTSAEIAGADYCALRPAHYSGYPQPEEDFGFRNTTYDRQEFCEECGVGLRQVAPFRVRRFPKWGRNAFLKLHWVSDEYFMRTELWRSHLQPLGIPSRVVEDRKGSPVDGMVQLQVDDRIDLDVDDMGGAVVCKCCNREYFIPVQRGFFPAPAGKPSAAAFRSRQYFGTGHNGFNEIIVSSSVAAAIVAGGLKGVTLWPCAPQ
jgi:hypothetical protein